MPASRSELLRRALALAGARRHARTLAALLDRRARTLARAVADSPAPPGGTPDPLVLSANHALAAARAARRTLRDINAALARLARGDGR